MTSVLKGRSAVADRWRTTESEMGSWFHYQPQFQDAGTWLDSASILYGSGRDALRGWLRSFDPPLDRVWIPTYYCHQVTEIVQLDVEVALYPAAPDRDSIDLRVGAREGAVVIEYFGRRSSVTVTGGHVTLDRSMLPWASHAYPRHPDAVFGSLRKALPVPDGGWLSVRPAGHQFESGAVRVSETHERVATEILDAMKAKASYLATGEPPKESFLPVLSKCDELVIDTHRISGASSHTERHVRRLGVAELARARADNLATIRRSRPAGWERAQIVPADSHLVLDCFNTEARERLKSELISRKVYPATLWQIPEYVDDAHARSLSERLLVLHVDARYSNDRIHELVGLVDDLAGGSRG